MKLAAPSFAVWLLAAVVQQQVVVPASAASMSANLRLRRAALRAAMAGRRLRQVNSRAPLAGVNLKKHHPTPRVSVSPPQLLRRAKELSSPPSSGPLVSLVSKQRRMLGTSDDTHPKSNELLQSDHVIPDSRPEADTTVKLYAKQTADEKLAAAEAKVSQLSESASATATAVASLQDELSRVNTALDGVADLATQLQSISTTSN
eukprot:CAMPEP_0178998246 /NCGR_PEP_ID=MMETSP0795-20121207/9415_1 /TAXON_ID=88552 /ORGANISM="Amoebophrya sp., Strain Ameob2" /LENGTH=203 /DNA_ID=CAMNT_0020690921 /DNA_START=59 /DNA_END=670 /DNA_ORIENTATION=-